jgi:hypothetical protein
MVSGISLANKCQLLFGAAAVLILAAALSVPWLRTSAMVHDSQLQVTRDSTSVMATGTSPHPRS